MKKLSLFFLMFFAVIFHTCQAQMQMPSTIPNLAQQDMMKRGYGMFIHFGINTFNDLEWSDGKLPVSSYNPTNLDPDQWVRVAKEAGFRYVLLVTKHHDGFCMWDSKYTDYDVASSPVKINIVKAVSDACKKYGIKFAIYYSLWDMHEPSFKDKDNQKYIDYMLKQLTELFTIDKSACELWLDGGWVAEPERWGIDQLYGLVKKFNSACAISVNNTIIDIEGGKKYTLPSAMTEDNKYYFRYFPSDFRLWDPKLVTKFDKKLYLHNGQSYYLPFEHTICISKRWNWFQKSNFVPTRDLDEIEELFYWSTDNDNCLVMNIPPDRTGRIREHEANTAIALRQRIGLSADNPLPKNGKFISFNHSVTATSVYRDSLGKCYEGSEINDGKLDSRWAAADTLATVEIGLNPEDAFNKISVFEYQDTKIMPDKISQTRKSRIQQYSVEILLSTGEWQTIYFGDESMGDCKVIRLPHRYKTSKLRFKVLKASAPPSIYELSVIDMPDKGPQS